MKTVLYFIGGCITALFILPIPNSSIPRTKIEPKTFETNQTSDTLLEQIQLRDSLIYKTQKLLVEAHIDAIK